MGTVSARRSLQIVSLLLVGGVVLLACAIATSASASITSLSARVTASSGDPCLVGRWKSTNVTGLMGAATSSGLAKMELTVRANGDATVNVTGSTPYVTPRLEISITFTGTETFRIISGQPMGSFSVTGPESTHITETTTDAGIKLPAKSLSADGFFDAADYSCSSTRLRTNFDLSEGGPWIHDLIATFTKL